MRRVADASAMEQAELDWRGSFARLILQMGARQQGLEPNRTQVDLRHRCLICCCLCAPTELNLFNTPIPPWVPGAAKRKHLTEYLTKLGTPLPNEGEARYYSSQSYTVNEGMTFHGTLDDIFKDAPATKPDVVSEEKSELARVAEELQKCQSQLSQLIEHVHGGRDQVTSPGITGNGMGGPGKAPTEGEIDDAPSHLSAEKAKLKKRRAKSSAPPISAGLTAPEVTIQDPTFFYQRE